MISSVRNIIALIAVFFFGFFKGKNSKRNKENAEIVKIVKKKVYIKNDVARLSDNDLNRKLQKWRRVKHSD